MINIHLCHRLKRNPHVNLSGLKKTKMASNELSSNEKEEKKIPQKSESILKYIQDPKLN